MAGHFQDGPVIRHQRRGVVGRHYQPSSTWPGPVEIAPAYRATEHRAVCAVCLHCVAKYNAERTSGGEESRDGREAVGAGAANRARISSGQRQEGRGKREGQPCLVHVNTRLTIARDVREYCEHDRTYVHKYAHAMRVRHRAGAYR